MSATLMPSNNSPYASPSSRIPLFTSSNVAKSPASSIAHNHKTISNSPHTIKNRAQNTLETSSPHHSATQPTHDKVKNSPYQRNLIVNQHHRKIQTPKIVSSHIVDRHVVTKSPKIPVLGNYHAAISSPVLQSPTFKKSVSNSHLRIPTSASSQSSRHLSVGSVVVSSGGGGGRTHKVDKSEQHLSNEDVNKSSESEDLKKSSSSPSRIPISRNYVSPAQSPANVKSSPPRDLIQKSSSVGLKYESHTAFTNGHRSDSRIPSSIGDDEDDRSSTSERGSSKSPSSTFQDVVEHNNNHSVFNDESTKQMQKMKNSKSFEAFVMTGDRIIHLARTPAALKSAPPKLAIREEKLNDDVEEIDDIERLRQSSTGLRAQFDREAHHVETGEGLSSDNDDSVSNEDIGNETFTITNETREDEKAKSEENGSYIHENYSDNDDETFLTSEISRNGDHQELNEEFRQSTGDIEVNGGVRIVHVSPSIEKLIPTKSNELSDDLKIEERSVEKVENNVTVTHMSSNTVLEDNSNEKLPRCTFIDDVNPLSSLYSETSDKYEGIMDQPKPPDFDNVISLTSHNHSEHIEKGEDESINDINGDGIKRVEDNLDINNQTTTNSLTSISTTQSVDVPSALRLAKRLFNLQGFRKDDISHHLSKNTDYNRVVAEQYANYFDFKGSTLDEALRTFLAHFCLTGETQERERVLFFFSRRYLQCNPEALRTYDNLTQGFVHSNDALHTLTCALMLLNTDLHGEMSLSSKHFKPMTSSEFVDNLSGLNEGSNFPSSILKRLYMSIKEDPIPWSVSFGQDLINSNNHNDDLNHVSADPPLIHSNPTTSRNHLQSNEEQDSLEISPNEVIECNNKRVSKQISTGDIEIGGNCSNPFLKNVSTSSLHTSLSKVATSYLKESGRCVTSGYMMRKCCVDPQGVKTKSGKRSWKMLFAHLDVESMTLYFFKNESEFYHSCLGERSRGSFSRIQTSNESSIPLPPILSTNERGVLLNHSLAESADDYIKRQHVFRLHTIDQAVFLFQTSDELELSGWIEGINFVASAFSAPPLASACGASIKFERPLFPSCLTSSETVEQQLNSHQRRVKQLHLDLDVHNSLRGCDVIPSGVMKASIKSRYEARYRDEEEFLTHEIRRYVCYVSLLSRLCVVKKPVMDVH